MSLVSIVLVGIAAVTHAIWNLATKKAQGSAAFLALCSVFTLVLYAVPVGWLVHMHGLPHGRAAWVCIMASALIHFVYFNVLNHGYRVADLSIVYPVARGTGPLLSVAFAVSVLGERPSRLALVGALLVVMGVFALAGGARLVRSSDARARAGLYWGSCTGLVIASYTVVDGYAVRYLGLTPLLLDYATHIVRVTLSLPKLLRARAATRAELQRTWRYVLVVGTLSPLAYVLVLIAMQYSPISYVAPARELSMLVGAFFGARLLGEGDVRRRIVFAAVIAAGVMLIALG
ncbi:MAG TPA: DMT family transporter [Polyangiales bacterium]|nr:DMT family transporter [Polyangiales bacterium]